MTWTNPRTWTTGEKVTAAMLNADVRDNLAYLKAATRVSQTSYTLTSTYTLTGSTDSGWVYADTTNLKHTFNVNGETAYVILSATARVSGSDTYRASSDYVMARFGLTDGSGVPINAGVGEYIAPPLNNNSGYSENLMTIRQIVQLAQGYHTYYLMWRLDTNTTGSMSIYTTTPVTISAVELAS